MAQYELQRMNTINTKIHNVNTTKHETNNTTNSEMNTTNAQYMKTMNTTINEYHKDERFIEKILR